MLSSATLDVSRFDFLQVGATNRSCLKVLPLGSKEKQQRVVVGDNSGMLSCFGTKKRETALAWQNKVAEEIACLTLAEAGPHQKMKIFTASRQTIHGFSKKGKNFYSFDTNLTEPITSFCIQRDHLWIGGEYVYNHFVNQNEANFYMAEVWTPSSAARTASSGSSRYQPHSGTLVTVGSRDQERFTLYGTSNGYVGQMLMASDSCRRGWSFRAPGGVTCLSTYDLLRDGVVDVLVGRDNGNVQAYGFDTLHNPRLLFERSLNESITSIDAGVVTTPPYDEVVIATYTGKVLCFTTEPVADQVADPEEIIRKRQEAMISAKAAAEAVARRREADQKRVASLQEEIKRLRERLAKAQESFQKRSKKMIAVQDAARIQSTFSLHPDEPVHVLVVESQAPMDVVCLQCDIPVELEDPPATAICSRTPAMPIYAPGMELLATYRCQESVTRLEIRMRLQEGRRGTLHVLVLPRALIKTAHVVSHEIRPLALHRRAPVSMSSESLPASWSRPGLNEMVCLAGVGARSAMGVVATRVWRITGEFGLLEAHAWMQQCLPDVPQRFPADRDRAFLEFRNAFLGTTLMCTYRQGECVIRSDCLSTVAVMKDCITKEATSRKARISVSCEFWVLSWEYRALTRSIPHLSLASLTRVLGQTPLRDGNNSISADFFIGEVQTAFPAHDASGWQCHVLPHRHHRGDTDVREESTEAVLRILHPRMSQQVTIARHADLIEALKEIKMQEEDISFLPEEYRNALKDPEGLVMQSKTQAQLLTYLRGMVVDLFTDRAKFLGVSMEHRVPQLRALLEQPRLDELLGFFANRGA
ncbi:putative Bardet-Biedl syndrome 7 protein [Paratrimastix pyriformis]|uniref:Bardet-Biedl syndrome 7 protein n=1 Tax=Paratrimastix pyriformis TaxID=342808 RepID=A0ABQ8UZR5_9EUKA|nr:putative Bardet-Biedl syndrome 7 protein [Paratrimastix pyriformis]